MGTIVPSWQGAWPTRS